MESADGAYLVRLHSIDEDFGIRTGDDDADVCGAGSGASAQEAG